MALYDSLFTMMDMQAAQLLVTASDFEHDGGCSLHAGTFRAQQECCMCSSLQKVLLAGPC